LPQMSRDPLPSWWMAASKSRQRPAQPHAMSRAGWWLGEEFDTGDLAGCL
jgi:hypothetical protein